MKFLLLIFCLACSGYTVAQTRVCSDDSVVLVLNGYKQGSTSWQQSPDRTTWSNAAGNQYNDSLVFTATKNLYYRAIVIDGSCSPFYSDTELVIINPPTPVAKPATGVHSYDFTANWSDVSSPGDTSHYTYFLDISTDPTFASFLTGYNNRQMDGDTIYSINPVGCLMTYYYRVRAFDYNCGTSANSNTITVTTDTCYPAECTIRRTCSGNITDTRDGKIYKTVQIGSQCWMAQNLNVGTAIPGVVLQTNNTILEKYCLDYGGTTTDSSKCATYGGLYLWDEMMAYGPSVAGNGKGPQGICPTGWHLPTDNEWKCLEMTLGMTQTQADGEDRTGTTQGNKLKTKGNGALPLWKSPSAGTDTSGFSALPGGLRYYDVSVSTNEGVAAYFWSASEFDPLGAWARTLSNGNALVGRSYYRKVYFGFSARCVKD